MTQLVAVSVPPLSRTHIATRRKCDVDNSTWGRPGKIGVPQQSIKLFLFLSLFLFLVRKTARNLRSRGICQFSLKSYGKNWSQFKLSTKLTSESNCTQQLETLEKRQHVGLLLGGGCSLFLFGLSTAEHIDFCAQGHVRISHMCGLRGRGS